MHGEPMWKVMVVEFLLVHRRIDASSRVLGRQEILQYWGPEKSAPITFSIQRYTENGTIGAQIRVVCGPEVQLD